MMWMLVPLFVLVWVVSRARRRRMLAGLDASKPVFSVEPPSRRVGSRKREAL